MTDVLLTNGVVVTQNERREIIDDGAVAVTGDEISAVGPADRLREETSPERVVDAGGGAIVPGLINAHTHVSDIFLRGAFEPDRGLYDWLFNVKQPAVFAMDADEHALAARLYCAEATCSGTTTFVENDTALDWDRPEPTREKFAVYDSMGVRNVYGAGIRDRPADEGFLALFEDVTARDPDVAHPGPDFLTVETEEVIGDVAALIETHHAPEDRQSVWPAPATLATTTADALRGAYRLAQRYDVMTTTHVAEAKAEADERGALSSIEYLRNVGYLGDRALLGHCVQIDDRDVRLLADTGTSVVHNVRANMRLGTGFAPIPEMLGNGVPVSIGTDNSILSDTVDPLSDARAVATVHKGYHRDPGVIPAQTAFDMVTCGAAATIGRADSLGSLEAGKQADVAVVDFSQPSVTPAPDPVHTLVYGSSGADVETVLCAGEVLLADGELAPLDGSLSELLTDAERTAADLCARTNIA